MNSIVSKIVGRYKPWTKAKIIQIRGGVVRALLSYDEAQLMATLRNLGLGSGDSVMLHSAFGHDHGFRGSIEQLTQVFIDAVGPGGHLLMVTLPYRSSSLQYLQSAKQFDVRRTPSMMGLVSEFFRRRADVYRSAHPTHPVAVHGPRAEWFIGEHPACMHPCGPGSPFDKLAQLDGKAVFFNVPFDTFTFFHHLEDLVSPQLPFALYTEEPFRVPVVDRNGETRTVTTYAFAPEAISRRRFALLEAALRRRGLIRERRIGNSRIQAIRVRDAIECTLEMSRKGEYFYEMGNLPHGSDPP